MFTASAKIRKPGGAQPDEFEQAMSQVLTLSRALPRELCCPQVR